MGQIMRRFAAVLLFCTTAAPGFQESQAPTIFQPENDVYVIYSRMLTNPKTSHGPDNNERYLIADTTGTASPREPCITPPKERQEEFREVLSDYELRKGKPRELKPLFAIQKPYLLLNAEEVKAFQADRRVTPQRRVADERFRGVTDLFTLSDVYFNHAHTLALTAISTWCGSLCALYQWKVFEKGTGGWVEQQWVGCITMADARLPFPADSSREDFTGAKSTVLSALCIRLRGCVSDFGN